MSAETYKNAPFFVPGETIVLTRNGTWLADGIEITHEPTRRMFATHLQHDAEGWFIRLGYEAKRITVEDTPYFIHRVDFEDGGVTVWLNDETRERLAPETIGYRPGRLVCRVKGGSAEARFLQSAYMEMLRGLQEDEREYFLELAGQRVRISRKD